MPASRAELFERLDSLAIVTETVEHPAVFTVEESHAIHKHELLPGGHTKNLFLKDKKGNLFLVVALNDTEIDLKTLHRVLGCGRLSFGRADLLQETLGVKPGSVTPFSLINDSERRVEVVLDGAMMAHERLNFHPLENTATTNIARDDVLKFIDSCGQTWRTVDFSCIPQPAA